MPHWLHGAERAVVSGSSYLSCRAQYHAFPSCSDGEKRIRSDFCITLTTEQSGIYINSVTYATNVLTILQLLQDLRMPSTLYSGVII